jgi:hypothetical protein
MPAIVHGNVDGKKGDFSQVEYDYDYPNELSLKPGSEFHNMIRSKIIERATTSSNAMKMRYDSWNKVDHVLTAYIPADVEEGKVKAKDSRKPISIVFPYSYAMMESLMAYLSPEDTVGAMLLELVVQLHCNKTKVPLALHTFFRDSLAYGLGIAAPGWEVKRGQREVFRPGAVYDMNGQLANERGYRDREETVLFEGNELTNIDPYRYLPDPNVGAHEIQKGEFVGWLVKDNLMNLLREEQYDEDMFNVRYLKHVQNPKSQFVENPDERTILNGGASVWPVTLLLSRRTRPTSTTVCSLWL